MIHTSRQLKALVRNISKRDSTKAQGIIRLYVIERFLERLSLSRFQKHIILKGGVLVSSMIGIENRATMDIDATIKGYQLSEDVIREIVIEICAISIDDSMKFEIKEVTRILDNSKYQGVRVKMDSTLENMHTPFSIDFSTGDAITPGEIEFHLNLMFDNNKITVYAYNLETILAEKIETLITRGTANTRMRDFYDIYILEKMQDNRINTKVLYEALQNTIEKRGSAAVGRSALLILDEIQESIEMEYFWAKYSKKFKYAADISWEDVLESVRRLCNIAFGSAIN